MEPLFRKVDCFSLKVVNLQSAIEFYSTKLGHDLKWKSSNMAGMALPDSDAELVVHTDERPTETDLLVHSVPEAVKRFTESGGRLITGPFDIQIGLCAVLSDPWGNRIVILDMSKGEVRVDEKKNVIPR